jgi:hypothetical protein
MNNKYRLFRRRLHYWYKPKAGKIKALIMINILIFIVLYGSTECLLADTNSLVYAQTIAVNQTVNYPPMPKAVMETLDYYAILYGVPQDLVHKIVACESNFSTDIKGDYQADLISVGLWQFQPTTFYQYAKRYKVKNADIYDYRDQTIVAIQMLRDNLKDHWTCGKKIK